MAWDEPYRGRLKSISFEPGKIGRSLEMCTASTWVFSPCNVLHVRSDPFIWIIPSLKLRAVRFAARIRARLPKVLAWVALHL